MKTLIVRVILCIFLSALCRTGVSAQDTENNTKTFAGLERWTFKTNALEWFMTIPNIGVEWDFSKSGSNAMTIGLSASYNWNTYHSLLPATVFNLWEVRAEYRYYWRVTDTKIPSDKWFRDGMSRKAFRDSTRKHRTPVTDEMKQAEEKMIQEFVESGGQLNSASVSSPLRRSLDRHFPLDTYKAKIKRANYVGAYLNAGAYALKLGKYGHQGQIYGCGITGGYALPMYEYNMGAVDIDLGLSVGLMLITDDVFTHNPDRNEYAPVAARSKGLHLAPFPVISEVSVSFAWRPYRKPKAVTAKAFDSFNGKYSDDRKARRNAMDRKYKERLLAKYARQQKHEGKKQKRTEENAE